VRKVVHKIEPQYSVDLPNAWQARVVEGTGDVFRYQEGDVIQLFAANQRTLEVMGHPRTAKGSTLQIPKSGG
jgi:hypothetical protein